jgi:hypothetical protein
MAARQKPTGQKSVGDLIERMTRIVDDHRARGDREGDCRCGASGITDHPRHVAEQIAAHMGLRREAADDTVAKARYVSAWFDDELTKLEGAE